MVSEGTAVLAWDTFENLDEDATLVDILAAEVDETPEFVDAEAVSTLCSREASTSLRPDEPDGLAIDGDADVVGESRAIVAPKAKFPI